MSEHVAFGGGVFLADKSVWARASHDVLREEWTAAVFAGQIVTCPIINLELLYSTRTAEEFGTVESNLDALRSIPLNQSICIVATRALSELAAISDCYHRVALPDVLIAATAQEAGVGVLHYDHHYDRLAEVLHFESRWAASPGSLD
jgi:predicted nucleic acid-binding protein